MHAVQDLVNKQQRQADRPSFFLPRLVWPSVPQTDSKQLDIVLPQDGQSKMCTAVACLLLELDFIFTWYNIRIISQLNFSGGVDASNIQLKLLFTQQYEPSETHLIGILNLKAQTGADEAPRGPLPGMTRTTHLNTLCICSPRHPILQTICYHTSEVTEP